MDKVSISVVILTKNSQKYLIEVLDALKDFTEVIIVDNGSNDNTLEIAAKYNNVKIFKEKFIGFGPLKNRALEFTSNSWVLYIDSDEIVKNEMLEFIKKLDLNNETNIYSFLRDNYYRKSLIKCCSWENDYVMRLFNKNHTHFNNNLVHESLIVNSDSSVIKVKDGLKHYTYDSIEELINKMQHYSTLFAKESKRDISIAKPVLAALFRFIKNYFFQKGFLYGYKGLVISATNANSVFYKYLKLYEKNKDKQ